MAGNVLTGDVRLINKRFKFECLVEDKAAVVVDYIPPLGDGEGHTSLELLLFSLATCFGSSIKFLAAGRAKKEVEILNIRARGVRREEHPTGFKTIDLFMEIKCPGLEEAELEQMIQLAESRICPVYAMIRDSTEVRVEYRILQETSAR